MMEEFGVSMRQKSENEYEILPSGHYMAREYQIEKILVEEIAKDKAIANPYINSENKSKVLEIANSADWDGRLKTIKEALPDVSYLEINAIIAKNK